jgi:hypothetical protein
MNGSGCFGAVVGVTAGAVVLNPAGLLPAVPMRLLSAPSTVETIIVDRKRKVSTRLASIEGFIAILP